MIDQRIAAALVIAKCGVGYLERAADSEADLETTIGGICLAEYCFKELSGVCTRLRIDAARLSGLEAVAES